MFTLLDLLTDQRVFPIFLYCIVLLDVCDGNKEGIPTRVNHVCAWHKASINRTLWITSWSENKVSSLSFGQISRDWSKFVFENYTQSFSLIEKFEEHRHQMWQLMIWKCCITFVICRNAPYRSCSNWYGRVIFIWFEIWFIWNFWKCFFFPHRYKFVKFRNIVWKWKIKSQESTIP